MSEQFDRTERSERSERPQTPHPPYDRFRSALGDHAEGHAAVDDLHAALHADSPNARNVTTSVERLRGIPLLEAHIATWLEAPGTQHWLKMISDAGL